MEKSNVIISIIIVVCIAAGVAAYGLTSNENIVFSDLAGVDTGGNGNDGLNSSNTTNSSGINVETGSGSGSSVGSGSGSSSGRGSGSGSSSGSGSGSSGGGGHRPSPSPSPSPAQTKIGTTKAKNIAQDNIAVEGAYAGTPEDKGSYYYVPIYSANDTSIGYFFINAYTGAIIEGGGGVS